MYYAQFKLKLQFVLITIFLQASNQKDSQCASNATVETLSNTLNTSDSTACVATQASEIDNIVDLNLTSNDKNRKKKDRHLAQALKTVLNSMNSLSTPEEKLAALCIKYADLMEENTKLKVIKIKILIYIFLCSCYYFIIFVI